MVFHHVNIEKLISYNLLNTSLITRIKAYFGRESHLDFIDCCTVHNFRMLIPPNDFVTLSITDLHLKMSFFDIIEVIIRQDVMA